MKNQVHVIGNDNGSPLDDHSQVIVGNVVGEEPQANDGEVDLVKQQRQKMILEL